MFHFGFVRIVINDKTSVIRNTSQCSKYTYVLMLINAPNKLDNLKIVTSSLSLFFSTTIPNEFKIEIEVLFINVGRRSSQADFGWRAKSVEGKLSRRSRPSARRVDWLEATTWKHARQRSGIFWENRANESSAFWRAFGKVRIFVATKISFSWLPVFT